ncbi:cysteine rich protein 61-like, partial [Tropilaelaps mercedesae]
MRRKLIFQLLAGLELSLLCFAQWDLLPSPNQEPSRGTFVIATGKMNITVNRSPFEERRRPAGCRYPCNCPDRSVTCQHGVTKAKDAAQRRLGCVVHGLTYEDNSVFNPDCRHQCSCQNGTVACANLCARELTRPSGQCLNARLVLLAPGDCCREWICDNPNLKMAGVPGCVRQATEWTECSSPCGQ